MDLSEYCRQLESYLCRKNGGHLVRIVGPAFEQVCGWAERGVPLTVACRGIDRYCERLQAQGSATASGADRVLRGRHPRPLRRLAPRRRRRAGTGGDASRRRPPRKPALAAHLERVVARLVGTPGAGGRPVFEQHVEGLLARDRPLVGPGEEVARRRAHGDSRPAGGARPWADAGGGRRARSRRGRDGAARGGSGAGAFGSRMAPDVRAQAVEAAFERLVRDSLGLPRSLSVIAMSTTARTARTYGWQSCQSELDRSRSRPPAAG